MPGDKYFFWNSIPNLIWIFGLVYYLYIRKSIGAVLVAMFIYLSLHGGYAIFAAATGSGIDTLNTLHYQSSDLGVKLIGAGFLIYCGVLLILRMRHPLGSVKASPFFRLDIILLLVLFLMSMVYGAVNYPGISPGKLLTVLKESIFSICMWVGMLVFSIAVSQGRDYFISYRKEWLTALVVLALLTIAGGFYEIVTGVVWAGTYYVTGFSYRASGTLFNPNVFGLWSALMVALISLVFHLGWISRRAAFGAMLLVIWSLLLSSSRSGLMLSIVNLSSASMLLFLSRKNIQQNALDWFWPPLAFMLAFAASALLIDYATPSPYAFLNTLRANLQRFLELPVDIFWIFVMKVFSPAMQHLDRMLVSLSEWLPKSALMVKLAAILPTAFEDLGASIQSAANSIGAAAKGMETMAVTSDAGKMMESVSGRILLEYISDNSFMSIYAIGGIVSLAIWFGLWLLLFWMGIKKSMNSPGIFSAYALTGLVFCFTSGLFIRAPQLFPTWVFLSMVLGACLCWWSSVGANSSAAKVDFPRLSPSGPAEAV